MSYCTQPYGYVANSTDCNDALAAVNPGATELCNSADDNCSGAADEGLIFANYYTDADGDGYGAGSATNACSNPGAGYAAANGDCNDAASAVNPGATEICNSIDDNCSGASDEGLTLYTYYNDADGDGNGAGAATTTCAILSGEDVSTNNTDCDDINSAVNTAATELCSN